MIYLTDDGTLDTVLRCSECGEEFRYNYASDESGQDYDAFVDWAIEDATKEHECPTMTHTPGRWESLYTADGHHHVFADNGPIAIVAVQLNADEQEANARLIVAAPEMYALIGKLASALYNVPMVGDVYDQQHSDTHMQAAQDARALLARIDDTE